MKRIPDDLKNDITVFQHGDRVIYLLGTAHVSRKSCDDVKILMDAVQPEILFLELCPKRERILTVSIEVHIAIS